MSKIDSKLKAESLALHGGQEADPTTGAKTHSGGILCLNWNGFSHLFVGSGLSGRASPDRPSLRDQGAPWVSQRRPEDADAALP